MVVTVKCGAPKKGTFQGVYSAALPEVAVDEFIFAKIRELLATMSENVDGLQFPKEIRAAVHRGIEDILSLFEHVQSRKAEARRRYSEIIEGAGGFVDPHVGAITVKAVLAFGVAGLTDEVLELIIEDISAANTPK